MAAVTPVSRHSIPNNSLYNKVCCFVLFFLAAAASFNGFYDKNKLLDTDEFGNLQGRIAFERFIDGTANRPFIYRQMVPSMANWVNAHVSHAVQERLYAKYVHGGLTIGRDPYDSLVLHDHQYFLRYVFVYVFVFLSAWAATYALYKVARQAGFSAPASAIAAIAFILMVPYFEINAGFYYDYPEIFFFALIVYLALRTDWWWLLPLAALATWNKESFLLFSPSLYPLIRQRTTRGSAIVGTVLLLFACAAVYEPVHYHFRNNLGGTVEVHIGEQLRYFLHPHVLLQREWNYGLLALNGLNLLTLPLGIWTVMRGWPLLSSGIRRYAVIAAIINVPLFLVFCAPGELRDLSMLYVPFVLLLTANLELWIRSADAERSSATLAS